MQHFIYNKTNYMSFNTHSVQVSQLAVNHTTTKLSEIVFQCVGSKESDWCSEIHCYHVNFKACHVKSTAVTKFTVISH